MALFFIDRPIFAWVIAIVIMLAGALGVLNLPIAQYPNVAPPQVTIVAFYPGASAQDLEDTVTQIIEQEMKGIDHLIYMSAESDSSGRMSMTLTFDQSADPDIAQVQVQNKLSLATPSLPMDVQRQGISVSKSSASFLQVAVLYSDDPTVTSNDLSDYLDSHINEPLSRLEGVGETRVFGAQYAMRIWLNPEKMRQYKLIPSDVASAISAQNETAPGGQIGARPQVVGQHINMTVIAASRLQTVDQFENIILRTNKDGSKLLMKDVGRVEMGAEGYTAYVNYNGRPAAGIGINLATGANALQTAKNVTTELDRLSEFFPEGLHYDIGFDTTPFVAVSLKAVFQTLIEAIVLVFLVMLLFLQDIRATFIPTIVVPICLLGTVAILNVAGFSLNTLTMFAMVLAIGMLVDDAIVVVENVERLMVDEGLSPRDAARKSMKQIIGALFGMTTVLTAVFIPMAFFGGSVGVIYRQFSITIVSAMTLSLLMALILTPALCATILKPHQQSTQHGFFGRFNRWFDKVSVGYQKGVQQVLKRVGRMMLIYLAMAGGMVYIFVNMPTGFLPGEDQGILFVSTQLPPGSTFESTEAVTDHIDKYFLEDEKDVVRAVTSVVGIGFSGSGQNNAMTFISLKDWSERKAVEKRVPAIIARATRALYPIPDAMVFPFAPPAIVELGHATGFDFVLQDEAGHTHDELMAVRNQLLQMSAQDPRLMNVRPDGLDDVPQYYLEMDLEKAATLGIPLESINPTIAAYWGSSYVNDFMDRGRSKKVYIQADTEFRMQESDFGRYYIRNNEGEMVPFSAFMTGHVAMGSPRLERYNGVPSMSILGEPSAGLSSGQAMDVMEEFMEQVPTGFGHSWTGMSFQERMSGAQAPMLYALSLLIVFLCLAALYESWSVPFSVMLVVPIGVLGALIGANLRGLENDIYFQVGLLTTIGLSAKNAILIVEFARENQEEGMNLIDATIHAVRLRLRPIIMTSLAFIMGVTPLAISTGAGSGGQNAVSTGVIAGMLAATTVGLYFIPVFYVFINRVFGVKKPVHYTDDEDDLKLEQGQGEGNAQ